MTMPRPPRAPIPTGRRRPRWGYIALAFVVFVTVFLALQGWILMVLWGAILPHFGVDTIGYSLAVLIVVALNFVGSFFRRGTGAQ